jgi:hypothetical protein
LTQALRSRHVSSASKLPARCDPKPTATPGLRPRLCGLAE